MSIEGTTAKECKRPVREYILLRITTPAALAGCPAVNLFLLATVAHAHVRWFVTCASSDNPIPLPAVAIQLVIQIFLIARATLPAAAAGIVVLYGHAVDTYAASHMPSCGLARGAFVMPEGMSCRIGIS